MLVLGRRITGVCPTAVGKKLPFHLHLARENLNFAKYPHRTPCFVFFAATCSVFTGMMARFVCPRAFGLDEEAMKVESTANLCVHC
jgi:hypothetical protein